MIVIILALAATAGQAIGSSTSSDSTSGSSTSTSSSQAKYTLGIKDANECSQGDAEIADSSTCQAAAEALGFSYRGERAYFGTPGGCMTLEEFGVRKAYFNKKSGKAREGMQKVCLKDAGASTSTHEATSTSTDEPSTSRPDVEKTTAAPAMADLTGDVIITAWGTNKQAVSEAVKAALITTLGTAIVEIVSTTEGFPTTTAAARTTSLRKQYSEELHNEEGGRRLSERLYLVKWRVTVPRADAEKTKIKLQSNGATGFKGALTKHLEAAGATKVTIVDAAPPTIVTAVTPPIGVLASGSSKLRFSLLLVMISFCANVQVALLGSTTVG